MAGSFSSLIQSRLSTRICGMLADSESDRRNRELMFLNEVRVMLRKFIVAALILTLVAASVPAGIRAPGKYTGIVLFDRWDTCYLYSGIYLMYISEKTKEGLRKYEGQSILLDAKEVYQPINPGDGRIGKFKVLKVLSASNQTPHRTAVTFNVKAEFQDGRSRFVIEIENTSSVKAHVSMSALALTLLGMKRETMYSPSDGKSDAWLTRQPIYFPPWVADMVPVSQRSTKSHPIMRQEGGEEYYFDVEEKLPESIELQPQEKRSIALSFHLPKGEYDFLCGYGGGVHEARGLASNRVSFDIEANGTALEVSPPRHDKLAPDKHLGPARR
jgi:hypothetical protein